MIDLRNTKIRILSPEHGKAFFDYAKSLGVRTPCDHELSDIEYPFGFYVYGGRLGDNMIYTYGIYGDGFFDSVHTTAREITFNSKTHEIEFINNPIKSIDLGSLSQQMGYDIRETETSDGSTASYYELPSGATELQHLISHKDMNSQIGEIFRSCYRYGQASHSDKLRDAKKIQFYINAEIERLEKLNAK